MYGFEKRTVSHVSLLLEKLCDLFCVFILKKSAQIARYERFVCYRFKNPNEFDISRRAKKHMSFGLGTHFCVGAPTARLEAEVVLEIMLERVPSLRMLNAGERIKPFFLWGRRHLPCAW